MRTLGLSLLFLSACIDSHPTAQYCEPPADPAVSTEALTYHRDIAPLISQKCLVCHEGGSGTAKLSTYADLFQLKDAVKDAVQSRRMPPWPAAACCGSFKDALALTDDERSRLLGWINAGAPEGTPSATPAPTARKGLPRVDLTLQMPEPYTPTPPSGATDDTRCFLLDLPTAEPLYVTGIDIRAGAPAQMHHGLVLTVGAKDAERLQKMDDDAPGPGWPCPGGAFAGLKGWLGGSFYQATLYPEGTGHRVDPGDKVVLTMHYSPPRSGGYVADSTRLQLRTESSPQTRLQSLIVLNPVWTAGGMRIPANETARWSYVDEPTSYNGNKPFTIRSVNIHMHERGRRGQVAIIRADGSRECLLQIDDWNHDWQGDYTLLTPTQLRAGDTVLVECEFDNTAGRQKVVNGAKETPRELNWGEEQEMCIAFVTATES